MKPKTFIHILIFTALALSACTQAVQAVLDPEAAPAANPNQPEVVTAPEPVQDIQGMCTRNSDETRLLVNTVAGYYCFQYPAEYDVAFGNANMVMVFKRSMMNTTEPNFHVDVQPAGGMTVEQAADNVLAIYAVPDLETPRIEMSIGGEKAIMLDGLSGQDPNRQVVVIHQDYLYTLFFMQMDKNQPELVAQAEALYDTVVRSFNFRPETNICPDCQPPSEEQLDQTQADPHTAMISGWVWHDQCDSGQDGQPAPATTPAGCVKEDSPLGSYHADRINKDPTIMKPKE